MSIKHFGQRKKDKEENSSSAYENFVEAQSKIDNSN